MWVMKYTIIISEVDIVLDSINYCSVMDDKERGLFVLAEFVGFTCRNRSEFVIFN